MKNNYLVQAWLVLMLAVCFGAALAGIEIALGPVIEQNKLNETYDQIPRLVKVSDNGKYVCADKGSTREFVSPEGKIAYKAFTADGRHLGWVIKAAGQGFADRIELLIGLDAGAEVITGMYVLDQKVTPALGSKITGAGWRGQFDGKSTLDEITVSKATPVGSEIKAISGATVSSESVSTIVNKAVAEFRENIGRLKEKE